MTKINFKFYNSKLESIRKNQITFATSKIHNIISIGQAAGYTDILKDVSPATKTVFDK